MKGAKRYQSTPHGKAARVRAMMRFTTWKRWAVGVLKLNMGGCVDCGFNGHPDALEFDHKPGFKKIHNVAHLAMRSWGVTLEEIAKCDLVCANCHRIRTATRRKNK